MLKRLMSALSDTVAGEGTSASGSLKEEVAQHKQTIELLEGLLAQARSEQVAGGNSPPSDNQVARELLKLITAMHPDRNPKGLDATYVCSELNALRSRLVSRAR